MLKKFHKLLDEPLDWKIDGIFKRSYTLYHQNEPLAHFQQESGIFKMDGSIYLHEAKEPLFIFRPKGLFESRVDVESSDIDFEPAKLKPHRWGGGLKIDFLNGNRYSWEKSDFWNSSWALKGENEGIIAVIQANTFGTNRTLTILSDAPHPAELNLLIFAGWAQYIFELQAVGAA